MKTRLSSRVVALCLLLMTAGLGFNSCMPDTVEPTVGAAEFGSIRVMNFIECAVPIDLYIYKTGSLDTVITHGLRYSVGSAYATNLTPGVYNVKVRPLNRNADVDGGITVDLKANDAKTVMIFGKGNPLSPGSLPLEYKLAADQNVVPAADKVYVRFLNTKPDLGNVNLVLDNPLNPPLARDIAPKAITNYIELGHALDTTYAIYLVKSDDPSQVIARLSGAAFGPKQFYTVVYAGNNNDCRDTAVLKADTLRLRYFDDNQQGNDLTYPIVQSLRFNFINGLIPPPDATGDQRTYVSAGVVLNNDDRFLIPVINPNEMARNLGDEGDGVITGGYFTIPWTDAIQVGMYANVYDNGNVVPNKRGTRLIDLRAGNRKEVKSDVPFSLIVLDTVSNKVTNGQPNVDSSKIVSWSVPIPDIPKSGVAQLVLVNALAPAPKDGSTAPSKFTKIFVNGASVKAFTTPQRSPKFDVFDVDAGGSVEIKVDIGRTEVLQTLTKTFTPVPGGIYEIVVVGQRGNSKGYDPKIMIIHTNKPNS